MVLTNSHSFVLWSIINNDALQHSMCNVHFYNASSIWNYKCRHWKSITTLAMFDQARASASKSIWFFPSPAPPQHIAHGCGWKRNQRQRRAVADGSVGGNVSRCCYLGRSARRAVLRRAAPILLILACGSLSRCWFLQVNRLETSRIQQWVMPKSKKCLLFWLRNTRDFKTSHVSTFSL